MTDAECGAGLTCITTNATVFDGEGPAKGYCTTDCAADNTVCGQFDPKSVCLQYDNGKAYCMEGCTFGPASLPQFDPSKCHGRQEVACRPLFDSVGNFTVAACLPQCNASSDCGTGLSCNPRTGLCTTTSPIGKSVGETCVQALDGGTEECKGFCTGIVHQSSQQPFTYVCTEGCTTGASPSCGWAGPGTTPAPAACLFSSTVIIDNGGPGLGDLGSCGQLCDCNSDCKSSAFVCRAWTGSTAAQLTAFFGKAGFCSDPLNDDGGIDPGLCGPVGTDGGGGTGTDGGGATAGGGGSSAFGGTGGSSAGGTGFGGTGTGGTGVGGSGVGGGVAPGDAGTPLGTGGGSSGCGCRVGPLPVGFAWPAFASLLLALGLRRRRRG